MPLEAPPSSIDPDRLATFRYHAVFLSDFHLGSGKTATPYLYEFLKHLDFSALKEIYLVGDVIGGWEHQNDKQRPLPEMEKRVLDIINYAASIGIKVHYLPGNHDEKLRPLLPALQNRKHFGTFSENVIFENESYYETTGPEKKRLKIVHGDQHDPDLFVKPWFRPITFVTSAAYDLMVTANYHASNACYKYFGIHVSAAKTLKNAFKNVIGYFFSHDSLLKGLENTDIDGIIMGHTHMAGIQSFDHKGRRSYLINDGDWVESSTCAYVDDPAELPKILNYKVERELRGFGDLPDAGDPHPAHFAALRPQTDRQVHLMHRLWPARNRNSIMAEMEKALRKIVFYRTEIADLGAIMQTLGNEARIESPARRRLMDIVGETKKESYTAQKRGLASIFNRHAAAEPLTGDDYIYAKTVVREFSVRSERKLHKHEKNLQQAAEKLDFTTPKLRLPAI